ncbi:hypothetical protein C5167_022791 [Papaver somniferum]|uniref:Uncharacterized protein n=1 Tax=Papaver somniferum TaxID=3469 RepID=A0A4Y7JMM5_PAPSO|nr:hypothetical protein C5167_022791 [Papaver somniferum]
MPLSQGAQSEFLDSLTTDVNKCVEALQEFQLGIWFQLNVPNLLKLDNGIRKASPESLMLHVDQLTRNVNEGHLKEIFESPLRVTRETSGYEDASHVRQIRDHGARNRGSPETSGYEDASRARRHARLSPRKRTSLVTYGVPYFTTTASVSGRPAETCGLVDTITVITCKHLVYYNV